MDYYKIGEQIRKCRRAHGLSQEQLAEQVGISVTHMSHIETGNTKLSLPVLASLADALDVQTDLLLCRGISSREQTLGELENLLNGCSHVQLRVITDVTKATKAALDQYME